MVMIYVKYILGRTWLRELLRNCSRLLHQSKLFLGMWREIRCQVRLGTIGIDWGRLRWPSLLLTSLPSFLAQDWEMKTSLVFFFFTVSSSFMVSTSISFIWSLRKIQRENSVNTTYCILTLWHQRLIPHMLIFGYSWESLTWPLRKKENLV